MHPSSGLVVASILLLSCQKESSDDSGGGGKGVDGGLGGGGGNAAFDCSPPAAETPTLTLTAIGEGFERPLLVDSPRSDSERLFVGEQRGVISMFKSGQLLAEPFLDISDRVNSTGDEQGLLGLAFHPSYTQNGRLFVHYTGASGETVISELQRSADPEKADPASEKVLITQAQPESNHNGGAIQFRSDGMLYIGLGDGGGAGDQHGSIGNSQSLDTLLGKILRIDVDNVPAGQGYGSPGGNMSAGLPELWSYGLRNPWRFSFDPCTSDMYIGDVGQNAIEEIDIEPAGRGSGTNWGWRVTEGSSCFSPATGCDPSGITLPVDEYPHANGCSVTGGHVYRGSDIPGLRGSYVYADFCSARFWTFQYADGAAQNKREITTDLSSAGSVSSFGRDSRGEIYVTDFDGNVWRIDGS